MENDIDYKYEPDMSPIALSKEDVTRTPEKLESDNTDQISAALAMAQGEYADIDANKKSYVGTYADHYTIVKSVRPALVKNKLCVTQQIKWINNHMVFSTKLRHASGQWIESQIPILQKFVPTNEKNKSPLQNFGSTLAYLERYAFRILLNVAYDRD